jgi:DNA replication protein DnaC
MENANANSFVEEMRKKIEESEIRDYGKILTKEERKIIDQKKEEEIHKRLEAEKMESKIKSFMNTVPARFKNATFDNFICSNDKQLSIVEFLKQGRSAVIYGSNGVGKTHLAFASCLNQVKHGKSAKYVLAFDFFNEIRKSFGDYTTNSIINEYEHYDYLVIDEIDKTQGTPMEFTYLYSLINKRYNEMKSTVLITNAKPADFAAIIGQSALDRVASEGKVIDLTGDNYRQRKFKDM